MLYFSAARVLIPFIVSFSVGIALTPFITHYLYTYKIWKKKPGKQALDGTVATEFNRLHQERESHTPRMGGIVIWASVLITVLLFGLLSYVLGDPYTKLNFFNRGQTWLPLFALISGALIGLCNDFLDVSTPDAQGMSLRYRLLAITIVSGSIAWWFYAKLGVSSIGLPLTHGLVLPLGVFFIPFFILVTLTIYASGIIDGIDGLAGGIFAFIFMAYAGIAFAQNQVSLSAFCATVAGASFAFLWFNIPPARFWMTETGTMALTLTLSVVAFSADTLGEGVGVAVLPIIAFPLFVTVATTVLQIISKRVFKKKLFLIAPIHHHFEAVGWPSYKVVMRYWVITIMCGIFGVAIALLA
jgi:phospho-N-acetylmuramoyl-pentapeptide-transferase